MNWSDPDTIVAEHGVKLSGWPAEIPLARPLDLRKPQLILVRAALMENACRWVRIPKDEQRVLMAERATRAKSRKNAKGAESGAKPSNKRKRRKDEGEGEDEGNDGDGDKENEAIPLVQKKRKPVARKAGKTVAATTAKKSTVAKGRRSMAAKAGKGTAKGSAQKDVVDSEPEDDDEPPPKRRCVKSRLVVTDTEDEDDY
ncbi:hypothetical protein CPB85DRAFT_1257349 [Mucidula mucida]|nr:hypothetical protein CPB85DRAFT_1257349 [Mucidula mucida]